MYLRILEATHFHDPLHVNYLFDPYRAQKAGLLQVLAKALPHTEESSNNPITPVWPPLAAAFHASLHGNQADLSISSLSALADKKQGPGEVPQFVSSPAAILPRKEKIQNQSHSPTVESLPTHNLTIPHQLNSLQPYRPIQPSPTQLPQLNPQKGVLVDDIPTCIQSLVHDSSGSIALVLDNFGSEVFFDLALAAQLLKQGLS